MQKARHYFAASGILLCLFAGDLFGDMPGEPYTVELGPSNQDLERQINAIPWTQHPTLKTIRIKDASHIDFSGRDLRLATIHLGLNGLYGAKFDNCKLDGSTFKETELLCCSFRNASLRFCELENTFRDKVGATDFTGADITGSYFAGFPAEALRQTKNYREMRLVGTELWGGMSHVNFQGFELRGVGFFGPLSNCDFRDAELYRMILRDNFDEGQLYATANYKSRDLSTLLFHGRLGRGGLCTGWDLSDCSLAYFIACDLSGAKFNNCFFVRSNAGQLTIPRANDGLQLRTYYKMVRLADIGFDNCLVAEAQLRQTVNWQRKDLRGMHLKNMALDGWDFSDMDMTGADLSGSSLEGADFTGADIGGLLLDDSEGLTVEQLQQSKTHQSAWRSDVLEYYRHANFTDLSDEEKQLQQDLRRKFPKK